MILGGGDKVQLGVGGLVRPPVGPNFCRFSTLKNNFFLVPNCMGFEQLKYSPPQQSPEKHKLISHSKQDKKPLRSYQFGSSADHLVIYVFVVRPVLMFRKNL